MAACPQCGNPLKEGDWTCGTCGARTSAAAHGGPTDPYGYAPGYQPDMATVATPAASTSAGGALRLTIVLAVVAILAIVAVWFIFLRGPASSGNELLGRWEAASGDVGSVEIARADEAFSVKLAGRDPAQTVTVPAHLDGAELVITVDDFATLAGDQNAEQFKTTLQALAGDFKIVFASTDATHLQMSIEGANAGQNGENTVTLVKALP